MIALYKSSLVYWATSLSARIEVEAGKRAYDTTGEKVSLLLVGASDIASSSLALLIGGGFMQKLQQA